MEPLRTHTGIVASLDRANVDTDQIIPKQFLKRIERTGFGQYLFFDWRFLADGSLDPDFELNQPICKGASILLARRNFGCGSSREHAPWALADYGFRVVIAPSFADIFYSNCFQNGMLPIQLSEDDVDALFQHTKEAEKNAVQYQLDIDVSSCTIGDQHEFQRTFTIDPFHKRCLLEGLDNIGLSLQQAHEIDAWESRHGIAPINTDH